MVAEAAEAAEATEDVAKRKPRAIYLCPGHPCNGNTFVCEVTPTSCHNCGGRNIEWLGWD